MDKQRHQKRSVNPRRKRILTWHIHGNYLYYLTQAHHDFYLPVKEGRPEGYGGRAGTLPWGDNMFEVPAEEVRNTSFDAILFQSHKNYLEDQYEILSDEQHNIPKIYLEHDPPRGNPTETRHPVDDPNMLLVHVTRFNQLMWDNGRTPTTVVEHGVIIPDDARYQGEKDAGIVVVNNLARRGRRLGADVFEHVRQQLPLDLLGMNSKDLGGLGELPHHDLLRFETQYRFFFNPIRYTSLGLAVCEAMMAGMPIVGLATTEMAAVVENNVSGYVDTDIDALVDCMKDLIAHPANARTLSLGARMYAQEHFNIQRFARDWDQVFAQY
jgi:glycosyltransferase involved in cell wall biosynthesis